MKNFDFTIDPLSATKKYWIVKLMLNELGKEPYLQEFVVTEKQLAFLDALREMVQEEIVA